MNILQINSSARRDASQSTRLANRIVQRLQEAAPHSTLIVRDLGREPHPALDEAAPYQSAGRYVNDVAEVEDGLARAIYGDAKYERLVALKRTWDPDNVFRLNQNIEP